jgi:D-alanyl-D-alanine carboxypeptidase/D-alanyl-D-alanine-endopeptidase (penicillin-binding protein 4)
VSAAAASTPPTTTIATRKSRTMTRRTLPLKLGAVAAALAIGLGACTSDPTVNGAPATGLPATHGSGERFAGVPGLDESALAAMNKPEYANGRWSISVRDIETGETLVDLDADTMAEPGSAMKSYSVGAAWLEWGPDHTIVTPVKRTGEVVDGTVQGDLVLVGKGDLTMGGRTKPDGTVDFADLDHNDANPLPGATLTPEDPLTGLDDLATQVKRSGIDAVSGQVVVDDRLFQSSLAGEAITPIVINQNIIDVTTTPGAVGQVATVAMRPEVAPWTVTSEVETVAAGSETEIEIDSPADGQIVVSGTIAAGSDPALKVHVLEDPSTFARTAFIEALERAGVTVGGDPLAVNSTATLASQDEVEALPTVAELESLPLEEDATYVMKVSYNRGAQTLICLLAVESGSYQPDASPGTECNRGLRAAAALWREAGMDTTGASVIDGSGLDGNLVTPANQTELQMIMAKRPDAERWRATLPILGVDGSLASVQPDSPAAGKVHAKTGTLVGGDGFNGRVRLSTKALGGVIDAASGRQLAFTIIANQGFVADIEGVFQANDDVGAVAASLQQNL